MGGAKYLIEPLFIQMYIEQGISCYTYDIFWELYKISPSQAMYDQQYLYGIIMSATHNIQQKTVLKYEASRDGILTWLELKNDFAYDESKELRLVVLENMTQVAYSDTVPGGLIAYLDTFQAQVAELITIDP
jgi:hypothetical protein